MSIHEQKKVCKIIDEISLYFLRKGHNDFSMHVSYDFNKETIITFNLDLISEEMEKSLKKFIGLKREKEVEEYGWELLGESDSSADLEMIGLLIDSIDIEKTNNETKITLTRKYFNNK